MMRERVADDGSEPLISLQIHDGSGRTVSLEAVIDTGFTGELTLPSEIVASLSLRFQGDGTGALADGSVESFEIYRATLLWHGLPRPALTYAVPGFPLVGMELLRGSELRVEAAPGGRVEIEELP